MVLLSLEHLPAPPCFNVVCQIITQTRGISRTRGLEFNRRGWEWGGRVRHGGEKFIIPLKRKPMAFTVARETGLSFAARPMIRYFTALSTIIARKRREILPPNADRCWILIGRLNYREACPQQFHLSAPSGWKVQGGEAKVGPLLLLLNL